MGQWLGLCTFTAKFLLFSFLVVSDSLWPHRLQHVRLPCPSLSPGVGSNSYPLSWWFRPTISSSVAPFSSCFQSFPASGSFPMRRLFTSGGQSGASPLASVLPINIQRWFPLGLTDLIFLLSKGLLRVFFSTKFQKHQFFSTQAFLMVQLSHPYMTTWKTIALTILYCTILYSLPSAQVHSLDGELRTNKLCGSTKERRKTS